MEIGNFIPPATVHDLSSQLAVMPEYAFIEQQKASPLLDKYSDALNSGVQNPKRALIESKSVSPLTPAGFLHFQRQQPGQKKELQVQSRQESFIRDNELGALFEERKSYHKQQEKRRRDCMKRLFDHLRVLLPAQMLIQPVVEPGKKEPPPSKLFVLEKTVEYVVQMQRRERDLMAEIAALKVRLDEP